MKAKYFVKIDHRYGRWRNQHAKLAATRPIPSNLFLVNASFEHRVNAMYNKSTSSPAVVLAAVVGRNLFTGSWNSLLIEGRTNLIKEEEKSIEKSQSSWVRKFSELLRYEIFIKY